MARSRVKIKGKCIVDITVGPRFTLGDTWYNIDNFEVESVTVTKKPYWRGWDNANYGGGAWWIELNDSIHSCGDLGIPGYNYDDRPTKLVRTAEQAEKNLVRLRDWLKNSDRSHGCWYE